MRQSMEARERLTRARAEVEKVEAAIAQAETVLSRLSALPGPQSSLLCVIHDVRGYKNRDCHVLSCLVGEPKASTTSRILSEFKRQEFRVMSRKYAFLMHHR